MKKYKIFTKNCGEIEVESNSLTFSNDQITCAAYDASYGEVFKMDRVEVIGFVCLGEVEKKETTSDETK